MFAASTPFVRPAFAHTDSAASAGYLYLGQAILLFPLWLAGRARRRRRTEADLGRRDAGPLLLGIAAGGLIAPGAFTAGLALVPAHRASLLLGLEFVFTLLIALVFRHESLSRRAWGGVGLVFASGLLITLPAPAGGATSPRRGAPSEIAEAARPTIGAVENGDAAPEGPPAGRAGGSAGAGKVMEMPSGEGSGGLVGLPLSLAGPLLIVL